MKNDSWNDMYKLAKQYYDYNGNLLIPSKYITDGNIKLGYWIEYQRKAYKVGKLSNKEIAALEKIGMVWSVFDSQWLEYYKLATDYYNNNGNLLIPRLYKTENGVQLGTWIVTQRKNYKNKRLDTEKIALLEKIGMVWSLYDLQWYEYYDLAVEYHKANGNLLIPQRYIVNDKKLGYWISTQRETYKAGKLSQERITLLEKIDMAWDGLSAKWDEMYTIAREYYKEKKNLSVSNASFTYMNVDLGGWIRTQRYNFFQNLLTKKQISLLNEIGMEWVSTKNPDYIWDKNYNTVLSFYNRYHHIYIPISFVTEEGVRIGVWLYDRKGEYKRNELSEYRKSKLDKLDKSWLEPVNTKSSFPEQAVMFYVKKLFPSATKLSTEEISEIDIYIPELKVGIEYDGPSHQNRVDADIEKSRRCKEEGIDLIRIRDSVLPRIPDNSFNIVLKDDSFNALDNGIKELLRYLNIPENSININVKKDYLEIADNYIKTIDIDWYLMYEKLKDFHKEYGHINVPISYKTPDGSLLGHWLSNIRSSYKNPNLQNIRLNSNKIKALEELGIDWAPLETQWSAMFLLAKQYFEANGNLLIPDKYVTDDGNKLGRWISTQRYNYSEQILTKDKIAQLEEIGMVWSISDYEWMKMYELAVEYHNEHGHLLVPSKYKTLNNISLGFWIGHQRKNYYDNKLSSDKITLLNEIGMIWSLSDYEWMKMYDIAASYYNENGNLCFPYNYITKKGEYLGAWIDRQRKLYNENKLSDEAVSMLNNIGMEWTRIDYKWMKMYEIAASYYNENGNLLVPTRYITTDGVNLGTWIKHQRTRYKNKSISDKEVLLLNQIGMVWRLHETG